MLEWIEKGGVVMQILLVLNCLGWSIMLWKLISLYLLNSKISDFTGKVSSYLENIKEDQIKLAEGEKLNIAL